MTVNYKFKTKPFDHQYTALERAEDKKGFAFLCEMGTGKSKMLIDNLGMLFQEGKVNFALIIAPKGVYRNWIQREIPDHMSEDVHYRVIRWVAAPNKKQKAELASVKENYCGLTIFVMNVEAFSSLKGKQAGDWLAKRYGKHGMIAVDESTTIKNPQAKRTKALHKVSAQFEYKRILTGSPITNSPLDIYAQAEFLEPGILGYDNYYAFRGRYAVVKQMKMGAQAFQQVIGYRNLDELTSKIDLFSYRVLKKDCLDLPKKIYTTRYVTLSKQQLEMYESIRRHAMVLLDEGELVTAPAVITQMLRLQQVMSGHLKTDDGEMLTFPSTRMNAVLDIIEESSGKVIIWSRFRHDILEITRTLNEKYGPGSAVSYFGDTSDDERNDIVTNFQNPKHPVRFFVGNPAVAGLGLTLTSAHLVIYYANDFNLTNRSQSEDRCHRIKQEHPVTYVDIICEGTIDERIVKSLQGKIKIGAQVLGEEAAEWLTLKKNTT
jgi:SNF2 family DNA or RNA helicase|tara:strand:+ start:151 stop:1620 length:1470 start_codon:yes stop_codon:yes gene_type:complete